MAYENFKPLIWSKKIQHDLPKFMRLVEDCNTEFEGEAELGKSVKIIAAYPPTIGTYTPNNNINAPETPPDGSVQLDIDQCKYFNFAVDDVDKAQSIEGMMEAYMEEATRAMAVARDSYVASLAAGARSDMTSASTAISNAAGAKTAIDAGLVALYNNSVDIGDNVVITITPKVYTLFRDKMTTDLTDNVEMIRKGIVGMYMGCEVKMSNNLYNDGTDDYCMIRTKKAIAFAGGINKVEAYRPELRFSDAVKGLNVYGAKIVRPKELYVIKAH